MAEQKVFVKSRNVDVIDANLKRLAVKRLKFGLFKYFKDLGLNTLVFRTCRECDGYIDCPSRIPNDEANCSNECTSRNNPIRCACNQPGNFTCTNSGYVCYSEFGKFFMFAYIKAIKG